LHKLARTGERVHGEGNDQVTALNPCDHSILPNIGRDSMCVQWMFWRNVRARNPLEFIPERDPILQAGNVSTRETGLRKAKRQARMGHSSGYVGRLHCGSIRFRVEQYDRAGVYQRTVD